MGRRQLPMLSQHTLAKRYEVFKQIGDGSFGTVALGKKRQKGAVLVAIKSMKKPIQPPEECLKLREYQSLYSIPPHNSIISVSESFYDPDTFCFHMVMEYMDQNLYQLMKSRKERPFDLVTIKSILQQVLEALHHCHAHNYFHRDIKPENILVSGSVVKLADFGLAREITSRPPYTQYVSTRWYRAPEVLLRAPDYSAPVDIWALGAMAVEIAVLQPLFPGKDEADQVWQLCEVLGSPGIWHGKDNEPLGGGPWPEADKLAFELGFTFPKMPPIALRDIMGRSWPQSLLTFAASCMLWDPRARPTSQEALRHEFFNPPPQREKRMSLLGKMQHSLDNLKDGSTHRQSWFRRKDKPRTEGYAPALPQVSPLSPIRVTSPAYAVKREKQTLMDSTRKKQKAQQNQQVQQLYEQAVVAAETQVVEHELSDRNLTLPTPRSGPVSSRTRRKQLLEPSEEQLLDQELQSAARAMKHLDVPSYAKPTVTSQRRASSVHKARRTTMDVLPMAMPLTPEKHYF
ncbi:kinase-like domain-containing protein [Protomyces lactucae-debilis]|uniref:Kinase-like domain-containing protein n=1 Tax=Protomyces lactucae-debilis TaxID=2754530 RepID=A0A1Y2FA68_PROLT|nr:kinase-like domain-containing protein [Protomyces lactucae-debilis]ORY80791.1 kinase-like domain-containing protein [Protomyces lactucae-debilis]